MERQPESRTGLDFLNPGALQNYKCPTKTNSVLSLQADKTLALLKTSSSISTLQRDLKITTSLGVSDCMCLVSWLQMFSKQIICSEEEARNFRVQDRRGEFLTYRDPQREQMNHASMVYKNKEQVKEMGDQGMKIKGRGGASIMISNHHDIRISNK